MFPSGNQWFETLKCQGVIQIKGKSVEFNRQRLYQNPTFLDRICRNLARELVDNRAHLNMFDRVAGHERSAIFAHDLARFDGTRKTSPCMSAHIETDINSNVRLNTSLKKNGENAFVR